jgi:mRNA interferase RelE/StbE
MSQLYDILIESVAHQQRKQLPGNFRQRVRDIINGLAQNPRLHYSRALNVTNLEIPDDIELRRIRLDKWRLIYAVNDKQKWVWVWGVRKRPPYDYEDLEDMIQSI